MREMDILCTRFVEQNYDDLSPREREHLERLLDCADQDILAWLTSDAQPADEDLSALVRRMRELSAPR